MPLHVGHLGSSVRSSTIMDEITLATLGSGHGIQFTYQHFLPTYLTEGHGIPYCQLPASKLTIRRRTEIINNTFGPFSTGGHTPHEEDWTCVVHRDVQHSNGLWHGSWTELKQGTHGRPGFAIEYSAATHGRHGLPDLPDSRTFLMKVKRKFDGTLVTYWEAECLDAICPGMHKIVLSSPTYINTANGNTIDIDAFNNEIANVISNMEIVD